MSRRLDPPQICLKCGKEWNDYVKAYQHNKQPYHRELTKTFEDILNPIPCERKRLVELAELNYIEYESIQLRNRPSALANESEFLNNYGDETDSTTRGH